MSADDTLRHNERRRADIDRTLRSKRRRLWLLRGLMLMLVGLAVAAVELLWRS